MVNLNLVTKYTFDLDGLVGPLYFLQLIDGTFILYTKKQIIKFTKNYTYENIITFIEDYYSYITSMKQLKNGIILCCNGDLYIYTLKPKMYLLKIMKMPIFYGDERIVDVIELKNGNIIGITRKSIIKINIKDNNEKNYELIQLYKFPKKWPINDNLSNIECKLDLYELPNNKILLYFSEKFYIEWLIPSHIKAYENKIYVLNLKNYN